MAIAGTRNGQVTLFYRDLRCKALKGIEKGALLNWREGYGFAGVA